ncbi:uncharacterized protein NPIL_31541 [Nephila pilipes]|uniref:Uncharacterized protein n=1 Tax=Nephila pilipes TaxID=299642 RepID=A0A8X6Q6D4_NEPPI|nr:uncharacterized protein NPIL_31541 [Nephila pilipes]
MATMDYAIELPTQRNHISLTLSGNKCCLGLLLGSSALGELKVLENVTVPRWINVNPENMKNFSIHTFCEASRDAYAAVTYLVQEGECGKVHFLASRSRISPLKVATIPIGVLQLLLQFQFLLE